MRKKMSLFETLRACRFLSALGGLPNLPERQDLTAGNLARGGQASTIAQLRY